MAFHKKRIFRIISAILVIFIVSFIILIYLGFLDWKKTLITKISSESTMFIGQEVAIEDLNLSLFEGMTLNGISVKNPKGFDSGKLLHIKKLYLKTRYRDLVRGALHFDRIVVTSPELTLMKDKNGNVNISEKLKNVFKGEGKSEQKYHIEEFRIESGVFDFNHKKSYRIDDINLSLQHISSFSVKKTLIKGSISYTGENTIEIEGWAHLKDEPKTFAVSISSDEFNTVAFKGIFERIRVNSEKIKVNFDLRAEGDTEEQIQFTSQFHIAGALSPFLHGEIKDIQIDMDGIFDIHEDSVRINSFSLRADDVSDIRLKGIITGLRKNPAYTAHLKIDRMNLSALKLVPNVSTNGIITSNNIDIKGEFKKNEQRLSGTVHCANCAVKANNSDRDTKKEILVPSTNSETSVTAVRFPYNIVVGEIKSSFKGTLSAAGYQGNGVVDAKDISVSEMDDKRNILKDTFLNSEITVGGNDIAFKADTRTGKIVAEISGTVKEFQKQHRLLVIQAHLPTTEVTDIRDSLWDIFPDTLLYAGLDGKIASTISLDYGRDVLGVTGDIQLSNVLIKGENSEYAVGPINGTLPLAYTKNRDREETVTLPSFERSEYDNLMQYYSLETIEGIYKKITIGSLNYGFKFLENITLLVGQKEGVLNIRYIDAAVFGGRLNGSAFVDISDGLRYRAGILVKGLSLTKLCDSITPIRGYISGKIDGIAQIKGSGGGISQMIGRADFWTYSTEKEKTTISREFLQKVGGASLKIYLRDRAYDKGIMGLYIKDGFIIFKELEISNKNLVGIKDLSVKVVPFNNKISIDHLMWTIIEAGHRAKKK